LDYGEKYWGEGTFDDYLAEREKSKEAGEGLEQDLNQGYAELTGSSETVEQKEPEATVERGSGMYV
jgi:hypothetical protein